MHAAQGKLEEARDELEHALRYAGRGWDQPLAHVEIMLRLAPVLADLGDHAGGAALLGEARQVLARCRTARTPSWPGWTSWNGGLHRPPARAG